MAVDPADITPTLARVGRIILPRTREKVLAGGSGGTTGTFTEHTVPDADTAQEYIDDAAREVAMLLGAPGTTWDGNLEAVAADVVATLAARDIEQAFGSDGSTLSDVVTTLTARYLSMKEALLATAKNNQTGGWRIKSFPIVGAGAVADYEAEA